MRGLFIIAAIFFALWSVTLTGNAFRVRWYLWAHVCATTTMELFLAAGGSAASETYYWLYVCLSAPILITAVLIAEKMLRSVRNRDGDRWKWVLVPMAVSLIGFLVTPLDTRVRVFMAAQAAILGCAGMQTLAVALLRRATPYLTLGGLWLAQAMLFFMYAKGLTIQPRNWEAIGEWLPAVLLIGGMLKLSRDVYREASEA